MRVLLVDFLAIFYRAYYGTSNTNLVSKNGQLTFAIYAFLKTVISQAKTFRPNVVIICDDSKPLFRNVWFPEYKQGRTSKSGDDFVSQRNLLREHLSSLGLPIVKVDGYEADDILATFAQMRHLCINEDEKSVSQIRILTGDRDILSLVRDYQCEVLLYITNGNQVLYSCEDDVVLKCKYKIKPDQFADYKALVGDRSDGILGIRGFGQSAACKFFSAYASLRDAKKDAFSRLPTSLAKKIQDNEESVLTSYKLACLYPVPDFKISFYEGSLNSSIFLNEFELYSIKNALQEPIWRPIFV